MAKSLRVRLMAEAFSVQEKLAEEVAGLQSEEREGSRLDLTFG